MKSPKILLTLAASAMLLTACNEYIEPSFPTPAEERVAVRVNGTVDALQQGTTRSIFENIPVVKSDLSRFGAERFTPLWLDGDSLGAFGTDGQNNGFVFSADELAFVGEENASSTLRYTYYPYAAEALVPQEVPAVIPSVQGEYFHAYDLCAGAVRECTDVKGDRAYQFDMYRPTAVIIAAIDLTDIDSLASQSLLNIRYEAATPLSGAFTMDITTPQPTLTATDEAVNSVELAFSEPQPLDAPLFATLLMAPTVKVDDELSIILTTTDYIITITTQALADFMPCCQHAQISIIDFITLGREGNTVTIERRKVEIPDDMFAIESLVDGNVISLTGGNDEVSLEFSVDSMPWQPLEMEQEITLDAGQHLFLRNTDEEGTQFSKATEQYVVKSDTVFNVSGNILYLVNTNGEEVELTRPNTFGSLFRGSQVVDASALVIPVDALPESACEDMFSRCSALTKAPALPATTIGDYCYKHMFLFCSALTEAPDLPATDLGEGCYSGMFGSSAIKKGAVISATKLPEEACSNMYNNCRKLTEAPDLVTTEVGKKACTSMFTNSTLAKAPALPATTLAENCYSDMFTSTALTEAPALPATTLAEKCYSGMFRFCNYLTEAPALPATTLAKGCYANMFEYCKALTEAPALPATTLAQECYMMMFFSCGTLTKAPELPATQPATKCYEDMFAGCFYLDEVVCYLNNIYDENRNIVTRNWLNNVAKKGIVYTKGRASWPIDSPSGIPVGWTAQ